MNTRTLFLAVAIAAIGILPAFAQRPGVAPSSAPKKYELEAKYNAGIAQSYVIEENTSTERTHSDSAKKSYQRNVKYFTTIRCIESREGVSTIVVTLDSLQYKFSADGKDVAYDSQSDITPKNFADLNNYIGPLNRPFNLTMDPYGAVSKIEGEQVDFWRDYLSENRDGLDSVIYTIWSQSLDDVNLLMYGDLQKRIVPGKSFAIDSSWNHALTLRLDGVVYSSKVRSKLDTYAGGLYVLVTEDTLRSAPQPIHAYAIPDISMVQAGESIVKNVISLSSAGTLQEVTCEARSWYKAKVANEVFTQRSVVNISWKLIGQFQW